MTNDNIRERQSHKLKDSTREILQNLQ